MFSRITSNGKEYRYYDDEPVYPGDVWSDISILQQRDPERTGYATQKPLKLLERLLLPVTNPGDLVVDLCCGSGTTLEEAQKLVLEDAGLEAWLVYSAPDGTMQEWGSPGFRIRE